MDHGLGRAANGANMQSPTNSLQPPDCLLTVTSLDDLQHNNGKGDKG